MEIKSFRFLIALVFISYQTNIQGFQDVNISENDGKILNENSDPTFEYFSKIDSKTIFNSEDINRKNPLFGVTLDFTKTFDKNYKEVSSNLSAEYQGDLENNNKNDYILESGQFIQIKRHNKELLFDGSFFIYFNEIPNLSDFATANGITFVTDLSDINMGLFKVTNLNDLQKKFDELKNDNNILSMELSVIDPALTHQ